MENIGAQLLDEIWENGENANENFEIEMDEDDDRDADGTLDGGVAQNPEDSNSKRRSSECDLVLYLACEEALDVAPSHSILRPGVVVSIGLDKSTKLSAVFNRYVNFCNEHNPNKNKNHIYVADLEFVHCQLLSATDTAEAGALMKNDRVLVRKVRTSERETEADRKRLQRDADRNFFQHMRHLMPDMGGSKTANILLDCQGKLVDESGRNQQVLSTTVRAHSAILGKRCPWLGAIIQKARNDATKRALLEAANTAEEADGEEDVHDGQPDSVPRVESVKSEEDDGIAVLSFSPKEKKETDSGAAEIEDDDEEDEPAFDEEKSQSRAASPVIASSRPSANTRKSSLLCVALPDHSPEAVKVLLEYCYSNRVLHLGQEAFVQACKSRPHKHQGPVPPYQNTSSGSRRWPNNGYPLVSFSVALAAITLAEEAGMHRLSLMCEVAASQLLLPSNVAEALAMCSLQKNRTENDLPRLRKASMDVVLRSGARGVLELGRTQAFRRALEERRTAIVPTLLQGTMEAVTSYEKTRGVKRDRSNIAYASFEELDREDSYKRERERRKRRVERAGTDATRAGHAYDEDVDDFYDPVLSGWAAETAKRSLKRMSHHLDTMASRQAVVLSSRSRGFSFPTSSRRSSGSRRRSNTQS